MIKLKKVIHEIMRDDMPQINKDNLPEMLRLFKTYEIPYRINNIETNKLKAYQDDYVPEKLNHMVDVINNGENILKNPILVANDNKIVDGHHRWLAARKCFGDNFKMKCIQIMLPSDDVFKLLNKTEQIVNK